MLKSSKVVRADVCVVGIGEWAGGWADMNEHSLRPVPEPVFASVRWGPGLYPPQRALGELCVYWAWPRPGTEDAASWHCPLALESVACPVRAAGHKHASTWSLIQLSYRFGEEQS